MEQGDLYFGRLEDLWNHAFIGFITKAAPPLFFLQSPFPFSPSRENVKALRIIPDSREVHSLRS
jgi:hypothetical protein